MKAKNLLRTLWDDVRFGARMFGKSPSFMAVAVFTLALGIGANTAIFSLIDALLLRELPVAEPSDLVLLGRAEPGYRPGYDFSYPMYTLLRDNQRALSGLLASFTTKFNIRMGQEGDSVTGSYVSGNYFHVLGVHSLLGRTLTSDDDRPAAQPVVMISYALWKGLLADRQDIIGTTIYINDVPAVIIGVLPSSFDGVDVGERCEVIAPAALVSQTIPQFKVLTSVGYNAWEVMGRRRPNIGLFRVRANLRVLWPHILARLGKSGEKEQIDVESAASGVSSGLRRQYSQPLWILMVAVGLVLLIACANVANLLLARGNGRQRELGIRLALGASRWRLVRQLLVEDALLVVVGAALGTWLAYLGSKSLVNLLSTTRSPTFLEVRPDGFILAFTAAVTSLAVLFSGLAPAMRSSNFNISEILHGGTHGSSGRHQTRLNQLLVVGEVALALVLLIGAGLFTRSLYNLYTVNPGFDSENVITVHLNWGRLPLQGTARVNAIRDSLRRARAFPGVRAASFSSYTPFWGNSWTTAASVKGEPTKPYHDAICYLNAVTPDYFATFATPVLLGRSFWRQDNTTANKVAIVNEAFIHSFFPHVNPIGREISLAGVENDAPLEIVGVVKDAVYYSPRRVPPRQIYLPLFQVLNAPPDLAFEIRTSGLVKSPRAALLATSYAILGQINRYATAIPAALETLLDDSMRQERLMAILSGGLGLLALALAVIGLYSLVGYTVGQRTQEIGIRVALGAQQSSILWMIICEVLTLVTIGLAGGGVAVIAAMRLGSTLISNSLFGIKPTDPATIAIGAFVMAGIGVLAGYIPARRALKVDPMVALRKE
ncbi:MAG TPA: ABC transporter permease [Terriglobia bacterium]|nr:ABC transporter permease [Terriglobia bacterium]